MNEKSTNDAAAFIRTIAEKRNRNLKWAEEAVRKSLAITETEALKINVIDLVAKNDRDLLEQIDGKTVNTPDGLDTLHTREAKIEQFEMGFSDNILNVLSDPNIVYIFFMLGVYGLLFELYNPGSIFPGVIGVICLILAFYAMHTLPVNYAGLGLIVFAIFLFIAEIKIVSHGLLAIGGVISLLLGSIMLFRSESALEYVQISWSVIIATVVATFLFFTFVIGVGIRALKSKLTTGSEGLVGEVGDSLTVLNPEGNVKVHGEIWNAVSVSGRISKDVKVRVVGVDNLTLRVELVAK
jgi:membrane-bound serine protease (ClpP class)